MNGKRIWNFFYHAISNYNLFIPDENGYGEELRDSSIVLQRQKYTTWLYILLLIICVYVLFYATLMKPQSHTIVISNIDPEKFQELYSKHGDLLSCPCSTITTTYKRFVSNTIRFHPVCSSLFITQQWIEELYFENRSAYGLADFRTVASSQFQLLSSFCSLSQDITLKNEIDINNNEFVSVDLLPESKIHSEINATVESSKNTLSNRIFSFINYLRMVSQANNFITAVNTNAFTVAAVYYGTIQPIIMFANYYLTQSSNSPLVTCSVLHFIGPTTLIPYSPATSDFNRQLYMTSYYDSFVNGFFTGCSPFEALLNSTLDCLYEIDCLQLLTDFFPSIQQSNLNLTNFVLFSNNTNLTVYEHLSNLFIDEWITTINYSKYFHNCNPSTCTYTTKDKVNYSYAITLFISLYGGLILILRSISPFIIVISFKLRYRLVNQVSLRIICRTWKIYLRELNLFKNSDQRSEDDIKLQKIITRVYLILFIIAITVLFLFNSLSTQTVTTSISNPSLNTYVNLQSLYTLKCPCSTMTIPYHKFVSFSPVLHQICSSDFITEQWITLLKQSVTDFADQDWRNRASQQFQLLSKLCQFANETVLNSINEFRFQSFIVSNMLTEENFVVQIEKTLNQFYQSTIVYFQHLIDAINLHTQVDQPFMTRFTEHSYTIDPYAVQFVKILTTNNKQSVELALSSTYIQDIYSKMINCFCSTTSYCQRSSAIFDVDFTVIRPTSTNYSVSFVIPGSIVGCSETDSLLLSTLECFYSHTTCFSTLMNYINQSYQWNVEDAIWFNVHPLIYNSTQTRFHSNSSISTILKEIMIEQWNPSYSYEIFYQLCSPSNCIYSERIHRNNIIGIIVILLSMIGGLIVSLRFLTPYLVNFITKSISTIVKQQNQIIVGQISWSDRITSIKQKFTQSLYEFFTNLNIFPHRTFGSKVDRNTAKYLGRLTTRLYILLLIFIFVILAIYTVVQQQITTKEFNKPTFDTYNQLIRNYGDQIQCPCSSISSIYSQFVNIEPVFHPICSSIFVSNEMINKLAINLPTNMSIYDERDYLRFILAHFRYLSGLCQISSEIVNNSIEHMLSTIFVSKQLMAKDDFSQHIDLLTDRAKSNMPDAINSMFLLIQNINFGNAIMSTYGTNFKPIAPWPVSYMNFGDNIAQIYDDNCSCGLHSNCTSQAYFVSENSTDSQIRLQGLKIGCTLSQSWLASTLECFYNQSCIDIIKEYTNYPDQLEHLSITNQSQISATVENLFANLFTDQWLIIKNYSLYYEQCSPLICSYTYIENFNLIYFISFLLGLQGGLAMVLQWICPKLIQFTSAIKIYRNKRTNTIHSNESVETITRTMPITTNDLQLSSPCQWQHFLKIISLIALLMSLIVFLVIFSIYIVRQEDNQVTQWPSTTTRAVEIASTDTNTVITSEPLTTTTSVCQLKFERTTIFSSMSNFFASSTFLGDFNNDHQLDVGFITSPYSINPDEKTPSDLYVLFGNGNGTFQVPIISSIGLVIYSINSSIGDFNHDNLLDIAVGNQTDNRIHILFGNGNGTFEEGAILRMDLCGSSDPTGLSTADFNNDGYLDIVIACQYSQTFGILFGDASGNFQDKLILNTGLDSGPSSIAIADLNRDHHLDIVVTNSYDRNVGVFLGHGNGTFDMQKTSFTGGGVNPAYINVGDFNEDTMEDVAFVYSDATSNGVMFGYGNGLFSERKKLFFESGQSGNPNVISDFNKDGHLDIATTTYFPYAINIYFGDGNGSFEMYTIFSIDYTYSRNTINSGDLNGDDYPDIIVSTLISVDILLNTGQCENES